MSVANSHINRFYSIIGIALKQLFLLLCLPLFPVIAQQSNYHFERIMSDDDVWINTVNAITQDNQGFIWLGTYYDIIRYDGFNFKVYHEINYDTISMQRIAVNSLIQDSGGNIWIATKYSGVFRYEPDKEEYFHYRISSGGNGNITNTEAQFYIDDSDKLWLTTSGGIAEYKAESDSFILYTPLIADSLKNPYAKYIVDAVDDESGGGLWAASASGALYYFDKDLHTFSLVFYGADPTLTYRFINIRKDENGLLWLGSLNHGIHIFNPNGNELRENISSDFPMLEKLKGITINDILFYREDVFIAAKGGLYIYNRALNELWLFQHERYNENSIAGNQPQLLFQDRSGVIWAADQSYGITTISDKRNKFSLLRNDPFNENSLSDNFIRGLFEDESGVIWIATQYGGINKYDRRRKKITRYMHDPSRANSFPSNDTRDIIKDHRGEFWVATFYNGLLRFDPSDNSVERYPIPVNDLSFNTVFEASDGSIFAGTLNNGLYIIAPDRSAYRFYDFWNVGSSNYGAGNFEYCYEDSNGDVWLGSNFGVAVYHRDSTFTYLTKKDFGIDDKGELIVASIIEDSNGLYRICTKGYGLITFDPKDSSFTIIDNNDGLPNDVLYGLFEDSKGNFWISSNGGIILYNQEKQSFFSFSMYDGLQGLEFNRPSFLKASDGTIFFGGINGLNYFHPDYLNRNQIPPKLALTSLKIYNNEYMSDTPINFRDQITLPFNQNYLRLEFAALDFHFPARNRYQYMLEGVDIEWIDNATNREAVYTELSPGEYIFRVIAANSDGVWNNVGLSLNITITPPFWQEWWFRIAVLAAIIGSIVMLLLMRTRRINSQRRMLEQQVKERTRELLEANQILEESKEKLHQLNATKDKFFSIIAHDLKNPFFAIINYIEILIDDYAELDNNAKLDYLHKLHSISKDSYELLHNLLDWSRSQLGRIEIKKETLEVSELIERNIRMTTQMALQKKIKIQSDIEPGLTLFADREMILTVLRNLTTNAIKFSYPDSTIMLKAFSQEDQTVISVIDQGVGMTGEVLDSLFKIDSNTSKIGTKKEKGTGLGLLLVKEFIDTNEGTIRVESTPDQGSTFYITLPKKSPDEKEE